MVGFRARAVAQVMHHEGPLLGRAVIESAHLLRRQCGRLPALATVGPMNGSFRGQRIHTPDPLLPDLLPESGRFTVMLSGALRYGRAPVKNEPR